MPEASPIAYKHLSKAELNHLEWALLEVRRTGSYYGNYSAFVKRQAHLEQFIKYRLEDRHNG
jgi:hypothetical protein